MLYSPTPTPTPAMYAMTPPQPPPHFPCPGYLFPAPIPRHPHTSLHPIRTAVYHLSPTLPGLQICNTFTMDIGNKISICLKALCNLDMGRQYRRAGRLTFVPCAKSGCRFLPLSYTSLTLLSPLVSAVPPPYPSTGGCTTPGVFKDSWAYGCMRRRMYTAINIWLGMYDQPPFLSPFLYIAPCVRGCQIHSPRIKPPLAQLPRARPRATPSIYSLRPTNQLLQGQAGQTSCFNSRSLGFIIIFVVLFCFLRYTYLGIFYCGFIHDIGLGIIYYGFFFKIISYVYKL